jgi:hypothetical protein
MKIFTPVGERQVRPHPGQWRVLRDDVVQLCCASCSEVFDAVGAPDAGDSLGSQTCPTCNTTFEKVQLQR